MIESSWIEVVIVVATILGSHRVLHRDIALLPLLEFVAHRKRLDLRELEGNGLLDPDCDHKALRAAGNC